MKLIHDEEVIVEICSNQLVLTTHRIRYQTEIYGNVELTSIMLEEIASCSLVRKNHASLLVMALLLTFIGIGPLVTMTEGILIMYLIIMIDVILVVIYLVIRHPVILITSAGESIKLRITTMKLDAVLNFINTVEIMKNERYFMNR
ncbi:hypothetical protein H6G54_02995 [Anabaena cylindrica FACHB-243]|uniref:Uncharacterized protein n=1 Tax=Anabaena cylindrica (strain ATCC 27899 / PCC 7122) TaxID=272123 RepID=K9ZRV0_ANACC|nr:MULTISPECIES: hypothetical protein [Anabaena]AFZ61237.1 hypothetical protein Anacy_5954 [Anabaena cylindrica PCC 7122]MBD2416691.1 hypothetical protein [Anabaena cylindrica FACHB-243]MBY5284466.1 hypothetical protein [Anabaena sp. CCAP 1446/1C]MBY5311437.1 hypothetical protein [Anabaena sp. CCAP 1446/1C]MCM2408676.1 hypothetical protein [Anabaena sp. CCAP 1446/1C]